MTNGKLYMQYAPLIDPRIDDLELFEFSDNFVGFCRFQGQRQVNE